MSRFALMAALAVGFALQRSRVRLMLAESCTGGMASSWLTDIPGSSHWFDGGVVSYANATKVGFLGVKEATIRLHGAVSSSTAAEMAEGLRRQHRKALVSFGTHTTESLAAASITGVAGPTGGTLGKPVGLVCFGWSGPWGLDTEERQFPGDRARIREQAALYALSGILSRLSRG